MRWLINPIGCICLVNKYIIWITKLKYLQQRTNNKTSNFNLITFVINKQKIAVFMSISIMRFEKEKGIPIYNWNEKREFVI